MTGKINKYGQDLNIGSLVIGTIYGRQKGTIIFGRISRVTKHSMHIIPMELGDNVSRKITNRTIGDVRLYSYKETYVLPEEDIKESLMLTKLSN